MKKEIIFLFLMFIIGFNVFAIPNQEQYIYVRNHTSKTLIINREFIADVSNADDEWKQDISDGKYNLFVKVCKAIFMTDGRRLAPNEIRGIISYYPWPTTSFSFEGESWEADKKLWERFDQIPFMEKMNNIFKSFRIATEDGSRVITLENLEKQIITKPGRNYIIEIYDD